MTSAKARMEVIKKEVVFTGNSRLWRNWKAYCRLLDDLEYNCKFENGRCQQQRGDMCCCVGCHDTLGHISPKHAKFLGLKANSTVGSELLDLWENQFADKVKGKTLGFWRNDQGCILPRWARSDICLKFFCKSPKYDILYQILAYSGQPFFGKTIDPKAMIPVRELRTLARKNGALKTQPAKQE